MDAILQAHEQLEKRSNLAKTIADVDDTIVLLQRARDAITSDPEAAPLTMAKLKQPVNASLNKIDEDLRDVNKGLNQYQKALDRKFKRNTLPTASTGPLVEQPQLINRAIMMHLLREGKFGVANALDLEMQEQARAVGNADEEIVAPTSTWQSLGFDFANANGEGRAGGTTTNEERRRLEARFMEMYHVLDALKNKHDLEPAIQWAKAHSTTLEQRGSNLEFELSRLKFVELYNSDDLMSDDAWDNQLRALRYAQTVFQGFNARYVKETSHLLGSLAYSTGLEASPYHSTFYNQSAWEEASDYFTREFCGLLGLSEKSPLYTAVTAGGIALPVLEKLERIVAETGGQWTSPNELPVETPLPTSFKFHSIFVCPVSKEQATDENPPMMLPCGHVIAKESLDAHSRGKNRMKCPYCPVECAPKDARQIFI